MSKHTLRIESQEGEPPRRNLFGELLNIQQAAEILGCSPNTVRNLVLRNELSALRVGPRMVRIRRGDLETLMRPYEGGQAGSWVHLR